MPLTLHAHPFSSYCQKVLIALDANATPFDFHLIRNDAAAWAELRALWPLGKMPLLIDGDRTIVEASIIVEHLDLHHPGAIRFVPADPTAALAVRTMDRIFDNYVMTPMQKIVGDHFRADDAHDPAGVEQARGRWTPLMCGSMARSAKPGRSAMRPALPIVLRRLRCSTPTGCGRFRTRWRACGRIARSCSTGRRSRPRWRRHGHIATCSRPARQTATEHATSGDIASRSLPTYLRIRIADGDGMTTFDDREQAFEARFAREEEMAFRVTARRNRLVATWAAGLMKLSPAETDAYCKAVVQADFEETGDEDVVRKLLGDLVSAGVETSEGSIRSALADAMVEARRQLIEAQ